jgi:hypothetical protein
MKSHLSFFDFYPFPLTLLPLLQSQKQTCQKQQKSSINQTHNPISNTGACVTKMNLSIPNEHVLLDSKTKSSYQLQSRSSMTGFKKAIYNRAKLVRNQLYPSYNRRKYNVNHYNMIKKQCTRLSRTYGYLSQKKINHFIAFASKSEKNMGALSNKRVLVKMIHYLESQLCMVMYRSLFSKSIMMAQQELRLGNRQGLNIHSRFGMCGQFAFQNQNHIFQGQHHKVAKLYK